MTLMVMMIQPTIAQPIDLLPPGLAGRLLHAPLNRGAIELYCIVATSIFIAAGTSVFACNVTASSIIAGDQVANHERDRTPVIHSLAASTPVIEVAISVDQAQGREIDQPSPPATTDRGEEDAMPPVRPMSA